MSKIRYSFDENQITATFEDGHYLWIAFLGEDGNSKIIKSTVFDPMNVLYELTLPVDKIVDMDDNTDYIWLAVEDATYAGIRLRKNSPLTNIRYYTKYGLPENCKGVAVRNSVYFMLPGELSGENAKLLRFNLISTSLQETIELDIGGTTIRNASSLDIETDNEILYIVTNEDPITLGKLYYDSGWQLLSWQIE